MPPARNELCGCGSGKRYKHCCGAVIPIATRAGPSRPAPPPGPGGTAGPVAESATPPATGPAAGATERGRPADAFLPDPSRSCGACGACCEGYLTASVLGQEIKFGAPCKFLGDGGCGVYEDRPADPCRGFHCAWRLRGNPFPESFRPDLLGVIILAKPWRDRLAYYLVPAGRALDANLLEWMRRHSTATGTPFLFPYKGRERGYGSPEFQKDLVDRATRGEPLLPGLNPRPGGPCKLASLADDAEAVRDTPR